MSLFHTHTHTHTQTLLHMQCLFYLSQSPFLKAIALNLWSACVCLFLCVCVCVCVLVCVCVCVCEPMFEGVCVPHNSALTCVSALNVQLH